MLEVKNDPAGTMRPDMLKQGTIGRIHKGPNKGELVIITQSFVHSLCGGNWWRLDVDNIEIETLPDGTLLEYKAPEA